MKEVIRCIKKYLMLCLLFPLKLLRTKERQILFENSLSHGYSDNIKPIAEYLLNHYHGEFRIILSVEEPAKYQSLNSMGVETVKFHSIRYYYIAMTSGFFVTNSGGYSYLPLKKDQIVINTWHGGGAYKKIGIDSYRVSSFYRHELALAAKKTTIFLSTCKMFTEYISKALLIPKDAFWEIGMPRNDILINQKENVIKKIRERIGLDEEEKLVLYAPTYRRNNDDTFGKSIAIEYGINPNRVCEALNLKFGGKWRFAIRLHPQISKKSDEFSKYGVMDLTSYEDMQELLLVADVMINDFSSSIWDFMLTGKPCFLYAKDLQHYIETTAVYTPVEEWPFPKSTSNEELEKSIADFDNILYMNNCKHHYDQLGGCETGAATKYICDYIAEKAKIV